MQQVGGWLEFNVPFQHKYGYIRDESATGSKPGKYIIRVKMYTPKNEILDAPLGASSDLTEHIHSLSPSQQI